MASLHPSVCAANGAAHASGCSQLQRLLDAQPRVDEEDGHCESVCQPEILERERELHSSRSRLARQNALSAEPRKACVVFRLGLPFTATHARVRAEESERRPRVLWN